MSSKTFIAVFDDEQKEFTLYTDISTRSSKFLQAALSKNWQESFQDRVMLKDVIVIALESYLQWLNTNDPSHLDVISMVEASKLFILGGFPRRLGLPHRHAQMLRPRIYGQESISWRCKGRTCLGANARKLTVAKDGRRYLNHCASIKQPATRLAGLDKGVLKAFIVDCL